MDFLKPVIIIAASYLIGSIPFSYLVAKWAKGVDIRKHGDGNVGASNVSRIAGKKAGAAAFLLDLVKGIYPVFIAGEFLNAPDYVLVLSGLAAITGHNWPIFLNFKGGKGMSTTMGVTGALFPIPAAILSVMFLILYKFIKNATFSLIIIGPFLPIICFLTKRPPWITFGTIGILAFVYLGAIDHVKNAWLRTKKTGNKK